MPALGLYGLDVVSQVAMVAAAEQEDVVGSLNSKCGSSAKLLIAETVQIVRCCIVVSKPIKQA